jgi:N,N'-diacetyllegionaminate synthase
MSCFVIAEAGVNHNGSEELALELVQIAAKAGADAIKFQTFSADKLVRRGAEKAEYQKKGTGNGDQYSMLKKLEMSLQMHISLIKKCEELNIEFMSTAFDEGALDFLLSHGMQRIKVPSGEITNYIFIRYIASKNLPIILSTGMSTMEEVLDAKKIIEEERADKGFGEPIDKVLTILHCTSNYPTEAESVNLRAMDTIAKVTQVPIGYSDHTLGIAVSTAAVALGAQVIEKHFSLSCDLPGPDHKASLEPNQLSDLVKNVRLVEKALGSAVKEPTTSELPVRELVRRSVTVDRNIKAGATISVRDLVLMRPGNGILPKYIDQLVGKEVIRNLSIGETLQWSDIK